jgi:hypothetical protein
LAQEIPSRAPRIILSGMSRTATLFEILIASPGDVSKERDTVVRAITGWNAANSRRSGIILQPIRWELDSVPSMADDGQAIINRQLVDGADILIAVFWARVGTSTPRGISGTAEEIDLFRSTRREAMIYFKNARVPLEHDADQLAHLKAYKNALKKDGLVFTFKTPALLHEQVTRHLSKFLNGISPNGQITSPVDNSLVGHKMQVVGMVEYLSANNKPWIIVETEKKRIYPQCPVPSDPPAWNCSANIGRQRSGMDKNGRFQIHLCSVAPESDYQFQRFIREEPGRPECFQHWPSDVKILDTKCVIRAD